MSNGGKRPTQQQILMYSFLIALAMLLSYSFIPIIIEAITPTPLILQTPTPNNGPTPVITAIPDAPTSETDVYYTPEPGKPPTPRIFPEPIIGTIGDNLPSNFSVKNWRDNSCNVGSLGGVDIYSVEIEGGTPPYEITFWEDGFKIIPPIVVPQNGFFRFNPPVTITRGKYIQVTIIFYSESGKSEWIDDLKYPDSGSCP